MRILFAFIVSLAFLIALPGGVDGQTCGDGFCETPETPENCSDCICKKWNPGHYIIMEKRRTIEDVETVFSNPDNHIKGLQVLVLWRDLEPEKDVYNFSKIDEYLDLVRMYDKQLAVMFGDRLFNSDERPVPDYLYTEPMYNGGVALTRSNGSVARLWDPAIMERSNLLVNALGERYDNDPNFESLDFGESVLGVNWTTGYTAEAYVEQLESRIDSAKAAFPNTVVIQEMNWGGPVVLEFAHYLFPAGAGMGGPDLVPDEGRFPNKTRIPAYDYYPIYAGKMSLGTGVQQPNLMLDNKKGNFTLDGFWDMGLNTLQLNYIYWAFVEEFWFKFKFTDDILPYINEKQGEINDGCPENHILRTDCGDGTCDPSVGENCETCSADCQIAPGEVCCSGVVYPGDCCSDNGCSLPERCIDHNCSQPPGMCDGLVLLHHYDNNPAYGENDTHVLDFSGHGNNGTVHGASWSSTGGMFHDAFNFDGLDDNIIIRNDPSFNEMTEFSVSAWFRANSIDSGQWISDKRTRLKFAIESPGILRFRSVNNTVYADSDNPISVNQWYHVVGTFDGTLTKLFMDGQEQQDVGTGSGFSAYADIAIGSKYDSSSSFFNGTIDEVAVWNRTLSPQEIESLHSSGSPVPCGIIHRADTREPFGFIDMVELFAFIDSWKYDSTEYPMWTMMEAVVMYYSG